MSRDIFLNFRELNGKKSISDAPDTFRYVVYDFNAISFQNLIRKDFKTINQTDKQYSTA